MKKISFNGQTAVITGAGQGLGKAYAALLASRGAGVVINDLFVEADGVSLAQKTAGEIIQAGGDALPVTENIAGKVGAGRLIDSALDKYGRIDVFIHNAGIFRNKPLLEMEEEDWNEVLDVHLNGAFHLLKRVLPVMIKQDYGRIVLITSSVGMFGLDCHAGYGAAKMGIIGLSQVMKTEISSFNIKCNVLSPLAATGHTSYAINREMQNEYRPEAVAPMAVYLCSRHCTCNGDIYVAGGGYYSRVGLYEGKGVYIAPEEACVEKIAVAMGNISDMSESVHISSLNQAAKKLLRSIYKGRRNHGG